MASTEKRGKTARDAVLEYCTSWTAAAYLNCWPSPDTDKVAPDATTEMVEETSLAVGREMMAMLRHEVPEQDGAASAFEPNESDIARMVWQGFDPKFPGPDQFNEPAPVPLWVEGRPGMGMPRREVTQDELRHLRLYPERDELSGGGLQFVGLLFFNAAERLPVGETKETGVEEVHSGSHSSKPGLRSKLKLWLEARARTPVLTKKQCLEAAQIELRTTAITMNMLKEVWRDARLPETWRDQGRRPGT